jgi:hypothetical protein
MADRFEPYFLGLGRTSVNFKNCSTPASARMLTHSKPHEGGSGVAESRASSSETWLSSIPATYWDG